MSFMTFVFVEKLLILYKKGIRILYNIFLSAHSLSYWHNFSIAMISLIVASLCLAYPKDKE